MVLDTLRAMSLPAVLRGKKVLLEGVESLLRPVDEGLAVGENDSEKLGSMRKESVKLLELFSKN